MDSVCKDMRNVIIVFCFLFASLVVLNVHRVIQASLQIPGQWDPFCVTPAQTSYKSLMTPRTALNRPHIFTILGRGTFDEGPFKARNFFSAARYWRYMMIRKAEALLSYSAIDLLVA